MYILIWVCCYSMKILELTYAAINKPTGCKASAFSSQSCSLAFFSCFFIKLGVLDVVSGGKV